MQMNEIERIWQEANISGRTLNKEKHISFRNVKSIHFIDKFKTTYKLNLMVLMITAITVLLAFTFGGVAIEGIILFIIFSLLVITGHRRLNSLKTINKEQSTLEYLLTFNQWLKSLLRQFQFIYQYIYPLLFLTFVSAILRTTLFIHFFDKTIWDLIVSNPTTIKYEGLPAVYVSLFLLIAILLSIFSKYLYKLDINSVYGQMKTELNSLLKEFDLEQ